MGYLSRQEIRRMAAILAVATVSSPTKIMSNSDVDGLLRLARAFEEYIKNG